MKNRNFKMDFIGIGAPRSGTSWLSAALAEHPAVCFSSTKELDYFNKSHFYWVKNWRPRYEEKGLDWYKGHFSHYRRGQIRGEFSVAYLFDREAPKNIAKSFPQAKILMILRNPVEAVYSRYMYHKFDLDLPHPDSVLIEGHPFLAYGAYAGHIENYYRFFDKKKVLILLYDQIKNEPEKTLRRVYGFLGVDPGFMPACLYERINAAGTKQIVSAKLYFNIRNSARRAAGKALRYLPYIKNSLVKIDHRMEKRLLKAGGRRADPYKVPKEIYERLAGIFDSEIKKLERTIGQDLSGWREKY